MPQKRRWPKRRGAVSVCTVGHSNMPMTHFLWMILRDGVDVVADVRSEPTSRYAPQFNGKSLKTALNVIGVHYVSLGDQLGGRPMADIFYDDDGYVFYSRLAESSGFRTGLDHLLEVIRTNRVAIMCSEEDPTDCHRRLLVGRALDKKGVEVYHLRASGRIQREDDLLQAEQKANDEKPLLMTLDGVEDIPWRSRKPIRSDSHKREQRHSSKR